MYSSTLLLPITKKVPTLMKPKVDLVISINVYKCVNTLRLQLRSIETHVHCSYVVILNCNESFFQVLKRHHFNHPKVVIHPLHFEKKRLHGSLTQGIANNMIYATMHVNFDYFMVLSGRTIFYRRLFKESLENAQRKRNANAPNTLYHDPPPNNVWHWDTFNSTLLSKYYFAKGYTLYSSPHEGMVFSYRSCRILLAFLTHYPSITANIMNFPFCVEEFALQTIACNESADGFFYLGNGCYEECDVTNKALYTRKIAFLT
jgi:hypothetical protein